MRVVLTFDTIEGFENELQSYVNAQNEKVKVSIKAINDRESKKHEEEIRNNKIKETEKMLAELKGNSPE